MKEFSNLRLFGGKIQINIFFLITIFVFGLLGYLKVFLLFFICIAFHEVGHILAASAYGLKIEAVCIFPFGCSEVFSSFCGITYSQEIVIAIFGPMFNLFFSAVIFFANKYLGTLNVLEPAIEINLLLAAINLFPALPLDGGRIMRAFLCKITRRTTATKVVSFLGIVFGLTLLFVGIYFSLKKEFILGLYIMGVFILIGAISIYRNDGFALVKNLGKTRQNIDKQKPLNVKRVAIYKNSLLKNAVKEFESSKYNIVSVLDENMKIIIELNENDVLNIIMEHGQNATPNMIAKKSRR
jgi:stage IV sporulation protein FB